MHSRAYIGQYSPSGDFFIAAFQVSGPHTQHTPITSHHIAPCHTPITPHHTHKATQHYA